MPLPFAKCLLSRLKNSERTISVGTRCGTRRDRDWCRNTNYARLAAIGFSRFLRDRRHAGIFRGNIRENWALRSKASRDYGVNSFIRAILARAMARARSKIRSSDLTRVISLAEMEPALRPGRTFPGRRGERRKFANGVCENVIKLLAREASRQSENFI